MDDIDHFGSRRVRTVGELLANQCRVGLSRTERLVRERMTLYDQSVDSITPQKLINPKALTTVIRDFFARSQLSQFMDQINPLAELTHKRRLSALGPGGLSAIVQASKCATFTRPTTAASARSRPRKVRTSDSSTRCPPMPASTTSASSRHPYRLVEKEKGRVTDKIVYLTADQEEGKTSRAGELAEVDDKGNYIGKVTARNSGNFLEVTAEEVDLMDVSPKQVVSVAAGLIPFLEHDDANRALMGSNMQRQGVPLLVRLKRRSSAPVSKPKSRSATRRPSSSPRRPV